MKFRQMMMAAGVALAVSGVALGQPMGGEFHHGGGMEFLHGLNLTDAQKAQMKSLHQAGWKQMKPIMTQLRSIHEQMVNRMLASGEVTAEALSPLVQQEETLRNQMDAIHLSQTLQMRALLTPEQLAQAASTHAKLETLHQQEHAVMAGDEGPE